MDCFTFFAPRSHPGPISEEALGGVVALEHVAVPTLELAHHAVIQPGRHHHSVLRRLGQLRALGCKKEKHFISRNQAKLGGIGLARASARHLLIKLIAVTLPLHTRLAHMSPRVGKLGSSASYAHHHRSRLVCQPWRGSKGATLANCAMGETATRV